MNPRHGAPKSAAPAACSRASSAPNPNAADGVARPGGIIEMTSAVPVTASTSGTGTASASASQRRPFASAANAAPISAGAACSCVGHLGERALAAGQRDHQVLIAVLGADDARLAHGQAGLPRDPARDGRGHPAVLSSRASRAAITGAAAPSRSSTWPNSSGPPPHGSGMSRVPVSVSPPTSPNSRIRSVSSPGPGHPPQVGEVARVHGQDQVIPG